MFILHEPSEIEILGYAQNDIIEVLQTVNDLPSELIEKLHLAYKLINNVQEYLFEH